MGMSDDVALSFEGVHKRFGEHVALDDVSFEVHEGEVFGLLGPNGAGKTTLIRLALDIFRADGGEVRLLGKSVREADHDRVSYLPEERGLYRQQKVVDVLVYLARLKGVGKREAKERAMHWLERVHLAHVANKKVEQLSKGMGQKVQIAASLLTDPDLAILDEPFSGLDPLHVETVLDLIRERREAGRTTILSTHLMDRVEAVCDRMVLMSGGERVLYGTLDQIRRDHARPEVRIEADELSDHPSIRSAVRQEDGGWVALLEDDADPATVLAELVASGVRVRRFDPVRVTIEDIFVSTVRGRAQHEASAEGRTARSTP